ncbi:hypothetical protein [Vulcanisaeta souniana]|uniref:Uncharacterized protein n=1 Tax=Vulcanisaeta souniana JCM 11219 TaxID=1293586 RepID=A0ABM8BKD9_9CREN|nr:hypothetical protein [Vulcanisaeta souniana]BDR91472.1 hypothetical protein Vsou_05650 [Vulcanisaeta souniana JCM 11219]
MSNLALKGGEGQCEVMVNITLSVDGYEEVEGQLEKLHQVRYYNT